MPLMSEDMLLELAPLLEKLLSVDVHWLVFRPEDVPVDKTLERELTFAPDPSSELILFPMLPDRAVLGLRLNSSNVGGLVLIVVGSTPLPPSSAHEVMIGADENASSMHSVSPVLRKIVLPTCALSSGIVL